MKKCSFCYKKIKENDVLYHSKCAKKILGISCTDRNVYVINEIINLHKSIKVKDFELFDIPSKIAFKCNYSKKSNSIHFTKDENYGDYLISPYYEHSPNISEVEDLTMHLAEMADIEVAPHALIQFNDGRLRYITRPINRDKKGKRYPIQNMCQLTRRVSAKRYNGSYEQVAQCIKEFSSEPMEDLIKYWEVVLFSWIVGNSNMHLEKFFLVHSKKGFNHLSSAFDLVSIPLIYSKNTNELALKLQGEKINITKQNFIDSLIYSGLNEKEIDAIFSKFVNLVPEWIEMIYRSYIPDDLQNQFIEIILERIERIK